MLKLVHFDYETRSVLNVKKVGAWVYSRHPSTSIICMSWAVNDEPVDFTDNPEECYRVIQLYGKDPTVRFVAHNAYFEQCINRNVLELPYPPDRYECTASRAAYMSLPRDLKGAADALKVPNQKDSRGVYLLSKLANPKRGKGDTTFWMYDECPQDFEDFYEYNRQDTRTARDVYNATPPLNSRERQVWLLDQEINFRGVQLDIPAVKQVTDHIQTTMDILLTEYQTVVAGHHDKPSQVTALKTWLAEHGLNMPDLQKATVTKALKLNLSPNVRRALELRQALAKISTSKYNAMLTRVDNSDGRLRDILLYCGAITNRWSGRGVQLHNMPRGTVNSDIAISHMLTNDYAWIQGLYGDLMSMYSSTVRGMLTASPGCELFVGDFSSIEAMVLPWLAGQDFTLDYFRRGDDLYCIEATRIFGYEVSDAKAQKYERSVGKVGTLALGYQGGVGSYGTMSRGYNVDISPAYSILWPSASIDEQEKARKSYTAYVKRCETNGEDDPLDRASGYAADIIKQRWRLANPDIVKFWNELQYAAIEAVLSGEKQYVGGENGRPEICYGTIPACPVDCISDECATKGHSVHLICRLPSGNSIVYPFARVSSRDTPWGRKQATLTYVAQDSEKSYQFKRVHTYGGKLAENVTQSVSRDILADRLIALNSAGFNIVLHVHDEAVADELIGTRDIKEFQTIMQTIPPWAEGLPIKVDVWKGHRYKK